MITFNLCVLAVVCSDSAYELRLRARFYVHELVVLLVEVTFSILEQDISNVVHAQFKF